MKIERLGTFGARITASEGESISHIAREELLSLLSSQGYIHIVGAQGGIEEYESLSSACTDEWVEHGATIRYAVGTDQVTKTVNPGSKSIALHNELRYAPFTPDILWFHCEQTPVGGRGETTLADGIKIFDGLSSSAKKTLLDNKLLYMVCWAKHSWQIYRPNATKKEVAAWFESIGARNMSFDKDDNFTFYHLANAIERLPSGQLCFCNNIGIHAEYDRDFARFQKADDKVIRHAVTFEDGSKIPADLVSEIEAVSEAATLELAWRPGETAVIDNWRTMHGRRAFNDGDVRKVYARFGYLR